MSQPLFVKKLTDTASIPKRGSPYSAGYDLSASKSTTVPPMSWTLVETGLAVCIPSGCYGRVAPRSGLALKNGLNVGAGVIDQDYRGPVGVVLFNHSQVPFEIKVGDRIAQLILEKIESPDILEVEDLQESVRGSGGFGSTGISL